MTVEVGEASPVQEALVVGQVGHLTTGPDRRVDELVDTLPAAELQTVRSPRRSSPRRRRVETSNNPWPCCSRLTTGKEHVTLAS